ncbi:MAG: oxygen-independent coproporphyrinogen III oxidase [Gammaproteobacteria bacterium]
MNRNLITKYNVPGPRYTSYPTVPYWDAVTFSPEKWKQEVSRSFSESNSSEGISLYIHLPYCESLCTFCGCNKRITKNHAVEEPYIQAVLREWATYLTLMPDAPRIREIHLGGGTPTFFGPKNLERLILSILDTAEAIVPTQFGFEANPNYTTTEHLETLYALGFRRLSLGVQDFDPVVQTIINRLQPFEIVATVTEAARDIGYESINYDLVYGLPRQKRSSVIDTVRKVNLLRPERIAFYSYAHVPWIKGVGQRRFSEQDLPRDWEKRTLYETGRELLEEAGYREIGMDHFALPEDSLYLAAQDGTLHRNFMGYTPAPTQLSIGLGVSSISDSWYAFAQNEKAIEGYLRQAAQGVMPLFRGHILSDEDLVLRRHILNIMCRFETTWAQQHEQHPALEAALDRLKELQIDGLVRVTGNRLTVTAAGRPFLRNICMALDARLMRGEPHTQLFSQII